MQTITCQPLPLLTQAKSGFGEQREVHEKTETDRRFHGAAEVNDESAIEI